MKNRDIVHTHESAKIYREYYKPTLNPVRLIKSILVVFISGKGASAQSFHKERRIRH